MSEDREKGVQLVLDFARNLVSLLFNCYFYHITVLLQNCLVFQAMNIFSYFSCVQNVILCFVQGEVEKGRELIQEGIDMRKKLGVLVYVAAGYCDLGSEYRLFSL